MRANKYDRRNAGSWLKDEPMEDPAFWNSERKRGEYKLKCIGRFDPDYTEIYNEYYLDRKQETVESGTLLASSTTLMDQNLILDKEVKDTYLHQTRPEGSLLTL